VLYNPGLKREMAKVLVVKESEDEVPALKELERDGH